MKKQNQSRGWWPLVGLLAVTLSATCALYSWTYYAHIFPFAIEVNESDGPRVVHAMYVHLPDFCDGHEREVDLFFAPILAIDKLIRPKTWEER